MLVSTRSTAVAADANLSMIEPVGSTAGHRRFAPGLAGRRLCEKASAGASFRSCQAHSPRRQPPALMPSRTVSEFALDPAEAERLANLSGPFDSHLRMIELRLGVEIANRGNVFRVDGSETAVNKAERLLRQLWNEAADTTLTEPDIHLHLTEYEADETVADDIEPQEVTIRVKRGTLRARGANQAKYLHAIATHDINFGIGPAGTGKTYLAVAMAVEALNEARVQRLVLVRPAVEAGEKLGFLPGDLTQKVDPYLRPLYDALYEMLGIDKVTRLIERNVI